MGQAVAHACMALRHAITHANGVELNGFAASLQDSLLDLGGKLPQRLMAGAELIPAVGNGNEWLVRILERVNGYTRRRKVSLRDGPLEGLQLVNCSLHGKSPFPIDGVA